MSKPTFMIDPYPHPDHPLPKPILIGGVALAFATIALIAGARGTGIGMTHNPPVQATVSRDLVFVDQPDGALSVMDRVTHRPVADVAADTGGFIRATLRGLGRNRLLHDDAEGAPFRLALDRDHQLWLTDLATGQRIDLEAFGRTNVEAFAAFLDPKASAP